VHLNGLASDFAREVLHENTVLAGDLIALLARLTIGSIVGTALNTPHERDQVSRRA